MFHTRATAWMVASVDLHLCRLHLHNDGHHFAGIKQLGPWCYSVCSMGWIHSKYVSIGLMFQQRSLIAHLLFFKWLSVSYQSHGLIKKTNRLSFRCVPLQWFYFVWPPSFFHLAFTSTKSVASHTNCPIRIKSASRTSCLCWPFGSLWYQNYLLAKYVFRIFDDGLSL